MDEAEKRAVEENLARSKDNTATAEKELGEKERKQLKNEVDMLKQVQKTQTEIMKVRQKKWDDEREAMKEEKRKLEYMLYDMIKVSDANKDKFKRIKQICDE